MSERRLKLENELLLNKSKAQMITLYLDKLEEIDRLTAESTKWESKFYDEAKKVDKAIEYIEERKNLNWYADGVFVYELLNILRGDKE